jgi:YesN/AraC family two-component response regulator
MAAKMMIVEDDRDTREILSLVLRRKYGDMVVCCADNGRTGVELFLKKDADIVITDVNMPAMGGVEMAQAIRELKPGVVFIFITADMGKALLERSLGSEFKLDHYIEKPVDYKDLFSAIEGALAVIEGVSLL